MNKDFQQLRKIFEGSDPFMGGGHQIVGLRQRKRVVPEWTRNNAKVRKLLLRSFPKLVTNAKQRNRAARWARIIHLYFRLQYTHRQVAAEMGITSGSVHDLLRSIRRVSNGNRADGTGQLGTNPQGRPKKTCPTKNILGKGSKSIF